MAYQFSVFTAATRKLISWNLNMSGFSLPCCCLKLFTLWGTLNLFITFFFLVTYQVLKACLVTFNRHLRFLKTNQLSFISFVLVVDDTYLYLKGVRAYQYLATCMVVLVVTQSADLRAQRVYFLCENKLHNGACLIHRS